MLKVTLVSYLSLDFIHSTNRNYVLNSICLRSSFAFLVFLFSLYVRCRCVVARWEICHHVRLLHLRCFPQDPRGWRRHCSSCMFTSQCTHSLQALPSFSNVLNVICLLYIFIVFCCSGGWPAMDRIPIWLLFSAAVDQATYGPHGQQELPPQSCGTQGKKSEQRELDTYCLTIG